VPARAQKQTVPPIVYQLDASVSAPRRIAGQLVVDFSDVDRPYTITFHCRPEDINLTDLIASGRAVLISDSDPLDALRPSILPIALVTG
jgi:hypothetical protein